MNVDGRIQRLEALLIIQANAPTPPPPPPANTETVFAVAFTYLTPSPDFLGAVPAGTVMNRVELRILVPFNDPTATVSFGLNGGSPTAFLAPGDSSLSTVGQFELSNLVVIGGADMLKLTISPGASTQGSALLLYKMLP